MNKKVTEYPKCQLFLNSTPVSTTKYAKVSRKQEVSLIPNDNFNNVWMFEHADP